MRTRFTGTLGGKRGPSAHLPMSDRLARTLVETALELRRRILADPAVCGAPFLLRLPDEPEALAASLTPDGGLTLMRGERAFESLAEIMDDSDDEPNPAWDLLSIAHIPLDEQAPEIRAIVDDAGLSFRRGTPAPAFFVQRPERRGRGPNRTEARLFLTVLRAVLAARESELLEPWGLDSARKEILELVVRGEGARLAIEAAAVPWPVEIELSEEELDPDGFAALPRLTSRWYAELVPHPGQFVGDVRRLEVFLLIDLDSETVLTQAAIDGGDLAHALDIFVATIDGDDSNEPGLPAALLCRNPELCEGLAKVLEGTGLEPTLAEPPELVVRFVRDLMGALDALHADRVAGKPPDNVEGWHQVQGAVTARLIFTAQEKRHDVALQRYFGKKKLGQELLALEDPALIASYFEWRIFDHRASAGTPTLAEEFLTSGQATAAERELVEARAAAELSLFRVDEILGDKRVAAVDLVSGKRRELELGHLGGELEPDDCIALRLYPLGEWTFAAPGGPMIPSARIHDVLEVFEKLERAGVGKERRPGATYLGSLFDEFQD